MNYVDTVHPTDPLPLCSYSVHATYPQVRCLSSAEDNEQHNYKSSNGVLDEYTSSLRP